MPLRARFPSTWLWSPRPLFTLSRCLPVRLFFLPSAEAKVSHCVDEGCDDFLPWLRQRSGAEISSVLSIGKSAWGRSLFASRIIRAGECIMKIPFSVQISPDNLLPELKPHLGDESGNIAKLALVILVEQKLGQDSEWAPYISRLPQPPEMHSTIFWSEDELEMVHASPVYQETNFLKAQIEQEYMAIMALDSLPAYLKDITCDDFMHAYTLVGSRAWGSSKGLSLIPFADFLNHDGESESIVLNDQDKQYSEVIANRDYDAGEEVLIRYGKFSNATLLLDFGFTLPFNSHDEVQVKVNIPHLDPLREEKVQLLQSHHMPAIKDVNGLNAWNSFTIKEVKSGRGKGRGIPLSLRAFARVLACTTPHELSDLAMEAAKSDGRLARYPLKNSSREIQAHQFLLSVISQLIEERNASVKLLEHVNSQFKSGIFALRRQMALNLLTGELRVLRSASDWLKNYFATLTTSLLNGSGDY